MAGKEERLEQIIAGCRKGSQESFSELVDIFSGRLYGYFYRVSGNREVSEDLLGELFVRLVEKIGTFKDGKFESWLFRVASNIFYDYLRAKQREKKLIEGFEDKLFFDNNARTGVGNEISSRLETALGELDIETREIVMLRYYSQMSFKEIANIRSEPIGTILSKVHRGLKRLGKLMEE